MIRKMKRIILINLLIAFWVQSLLAGDKIPKIDEVLNYYVNNFGFSGTVLIAKNGTPIYDKSFGLANRTWNISNNEDTKFRIYSMSKAFVSMITFQLIKEGKINLNDKLVEYLPNFKSDTLKKVTIHNLLTHTSGIPDFRNRIESQEKFDRLSFSSEEFIKEFIDKKLEFEPGTKVKYSNSNFYLLAVIIEKITGKKYTESLNERIIKPMRMTNTGIENPMEIPKNMATGYAIGYDGYAVANYINIDNLKGCGDIYSTVKDILKWDQALYTQELLSDSLKKIMYTPLKGNIFACGWQIERRILKEINDTINLIRHSGGCWGYRSNIIRINNNQYTIIILSNSEMNNTVFMSIGDNLINTIFDVSLKYPKIPISQYLYPIIKKSGIEKAIQEYYSIKEKESEKFIFHFGELMTLGEYLVNTQKYDEALGIYQTNVKEYPDNWLVYADLGNICFTMKDKVNAIKNYAKSLELNKQSNSFEIQVHKEIQDKLKILNE
jgi:CubicO group peptidase (beta-lactamase class C family)